MVPVFLQSHLWRLLISNVRVDWTKIQNFVYFKKIKYYPYMYSTYCTCIDSHMNASLEL